MTNAHVPSSVAVRLGYLAVLPFVVGAVLVWTVDADLHPMASLALSIYAAVVVSFIGAIHWGLGFAKVDPAPRLFVWGVVPAILACLAALMPARFGLVAQGGSARDVLSRRPPRLSDRRCRPLAAVALAAHGRRDRELPGRRGGQLT